MAIREGFLEGSRGGTEQRKGSHFGGYSNILGTSVRSLFMRKDGEFVKLVFAHNNPLGAWAHFVNIPGVHLGWMYCLGNDSKPCPLCAIAESGSRKVRPRKWIAMFVGIDMLGWKSSDGKEGGKGEPCIIALSWSSMEMYRQAVETLENMSSKEPVDVVWRIIRKGTGRDTRYSFVPLVKEEFEITPLLEKLRGSYLDVASEMLFVPSEEILGAISDSCGFKQGSSDDGDRESEQDENVVDSSPKKGEKSSVKENVGSNKAEKKSSDFEVDEFVEDSDVDLTEFDEEDPIPY